MSAQEKSRDLPGYKVDAVEAWVRENVSGLTPPFEWVQLQGGHSNLTYRLKNADGHEAVIRRPPEGELLPKAHDMGREWSVISALDPTPVPVASPLGFCEDKSVTGSLFYLMSWVDGHSLHAAPHAEEHLPEASRTKAAQVALHSLDPEEIGLDGLGKHDGYVARQLKAWYRSWTASAADSKLEDQRAHDLEAFLTANIPDQGAPRVVHGDYGMHNVLFGADHTVAAVIDWEICTLGDPIADFAYTLNQFTDPSDLEPPPPEAVSALPGFPTRTELATRYAEKSGRDLSLLDYYIAFNHWKTACIVQGVVARYRAGQKSTEGINLDLLDDRVLRSLARATEAVERLQTAS